MRSQQEWSLQAMYHKIKVSRKKTFLHAAIVARHKANEAEKAAREALERARAECGDELEDEVEEEDSWLQAA